MSRRLKLFLICLSSVWISCGEKNLIEDKGSTVGVGFYPAGDTFVDDGEQGVVYICRSGVEIREFSSLSVKEMPKQKLTLDQPDGTLSEALLAAVRRLKRLDSARAQALEDFVTKQMQNINFASSSLPVITPKSGAEIGDGCSLERVYERNDTSILFSKELWDHANIAEKVALLIELGSNETWSPKISGEKSRSITGLVMSKEISDISIKDYGKYIKDLQEK